MILTVDAYMAHRMREMIRIRIEEVMDQLAAGSGVQDYAAYQKLVGQIRGLNDALEVMDEAEKAARER